MILRARSALEYFRVRLPGFTEVVVTKPNTRELIRAAVDTVSGEFESRIEKVSEDLVHVWIGPKGTRPSTERWWEPPPELAPEDR